MSRIDFPQLIPARIAALLKRVADLEWIERSSVAVEGGPVNPDCLPFERAARGPWKPVERFETFGPGGGSWGSRWFRIPLPKAPAAARGLRHLIWDCNGETTVYVDGVPWAGLDVAHASCPLPDRACTLHLETGLWQTAIWHPGRPLDGAGSRFDGAWIGLRDLGAWDAWADLDVLAMMMESWLGDAGWSPQANEGRMSLPERLPRAARLLLAGLNRAADAFDTGGVAALGPVLRRLRTELPAESWQPTAALTGHAHLDLVWHWPEHVTLRKAAHTFGTVLRLMERYPEFRFSGSQPYLYRAIEEDEPELARQIGKRVASGQWELTGGMEVEADNLVPCGEALVRCLRYGQEAFKRLRGSHSSVVWIPDVFGYSACLPQLMAQSGISGFFTTKMTWSAINRFPHHSFTWRGHDGSSVLTHLCPGGYNGATHIAQIKPMAQAYAQADVHDEVLMPVGYGDGAGGPSERMCERARRMADIAGSPRTQWVTIEPFFARLAAVQDQLPVYQGELYLEYHRGTYTTQSALKAAYRAGERALQLNEAVLACTGGDPLVAEDWQRLLFAQFHDALPGSSIGLVYEEMVPDLQRLAQRQIAAAERRLRSTGRRKGHLVFNGLPLSRRAVARLPVEDLPEDLLGLSTPDGRLLPVQRVDDTEGPAWLTSLDLVALGSERLVPSDESVPGHGAWEVSPDRLDNGIVRARFKGGNLHSLSIDGAEMAVTGSGFTLADDYPARYDAWDIDQPAMRLAEAVATGMTLKVIERGPVRSVLRGSARIGAASRLMVDWILAAGSAELQVAVTVDWQEDHRLLKFRIGTGYRGRQARYGCAFGSVERTQQPGVELDEARWEVPGSRWAAVTDDDGHDGLALLTEAKYGFHARDGELGLSLLRATRYPDTDADRGRHHMRFAIAAHRPLHQADRPNTAAAADMLYGPLAVVRGGTMQPPPCAFDDLGSLVPAWVAPDPDQGGLLVRCHETMGRRGTATLVTLKGAERVELVDLLGRTIAEVPRADRHTWRIGYRPYQLLSFRIR